MASDADGSGQAGFAAADFFPQSSHEETIDASREPKAPELHAVGRMRARGDPALRVRYPAMVDVFRATRVG